MRDGFVKVGAATPDILVADCVHNREEIVKKVKEMAEACDMPYYHFFQKKWQKQEQR